MPKHCIFEHFLRFVKQIRPKPSVVVTLQGQDVVQDLPPPALRFPEVVLICWKLEAQWDLIGLLLWALNPFKMILFWGLENPAAP